MDSRQMFTNSTAHGRGLHMPDALQVTATKLPRTIRDAMLLVRLLGIGYLWVDSLCIVQDDEEHKSKQIANMGKIYQEACFVILAAYMSSCDT